MDFDELFEQLFEIGENALFNRQQHRRFLRTTLMDYLLELDYGDFEALRSAWRMARAENDYQD